MVAVTDDGIQQIFIGVLTQVSKHWEVGWDKTTAITMAYEGFMLSVSEE